MMLPPSSFIGMIGGGQLARMLSMAAASLGYKTIILDPDPDCPAAQVANSVIVAPYNEESALHQLFQSVSVVTYEFENISFSSIQNVMKETPVYPPLNALEISQDRWKEKKFLNEIGLKTVDFYPVDSRKDLLEGLKKFDGIGILKTRRMGYDGRGQTFVTEENVEDVAVDFLHHPCILEKKVSFSAEISIIAVRNLQGDLDAYEPSENVHQQGILRTATVPASISSALAHQAKEYAFRLLESLNYVGVSGIEFFLLDDALIVNEFAPRVHNSGHWTEAACLISQFEQHIRSIAGLPMGSCFRHSSCIMENLIGNDVENVQKLLEDPTLLLRLYGKKTVQNNRKMGHFTRCKRFSS